jgi:hypothetical protein
MTERIASSEESVDMDAFRQEIAELKAQDSDHHLPSVNPQDLTAFDAVTWHRYLAGTLTIPEFNRRRSEAVSDLTIDDSRTLFYAYMGNDWYDRHGAPIT